MNRLWGVAVFIFLAQGLQAQGTGPLYVVDGEFDGGQNSTLYRIDPGSGEVLETIGDTGEHLIAIAVDPETGNIIGLTAPDSANPDSLVRIDPDTAQASGIVALVPPDGEEMPEFLDMFILGFQNPSPIATASNPADGGDPLHYVLFRETGELSPRAPDGVPLIPGDSTGVAARQTAVFGIGFMVMFGCDVASGESSLVGYTVVNPGLPVDPPPPWVSIPLPDQTCVTAGTRADGHTFYGVGVPFAEGASRSLLRIDLAGDGSAAVETLGPLPDDAAGIAFGPIPQPSAIPALGGTGRALLIALLLLAAGLMVRRSAGSARHREG